MHLAMAAMAFGVAAGRVNFRGAGQLQKSQINEALLDEMAHTDKDLASYEEGLRHMFVSLPKNGHGNLGHEAVRTALHRYFVHRHGWWLRGLYLSASSDNATTVEEKDRVPDLLQEAFEKRSLERGADLHALAALAASVDDLVTKETRAHLEDSYMATQATSDHDVNLDLGRQIIRTYFMSFLLEHNWTVENSDDLQQKGRIFSARYPLYGNASAWLSDVFQHATGSAPVVGLDTMLGVANKIGEEYHVLNDRECTDLRGALQQMESKKPGRVRLSVFYNMSLHSHWKFNEKVETLRDLGALDESDPAAKYVIISNYAMARPNCVNASNIYEICCANECEHIMGHLERSIGNSTATPQRIVELVSQLKSQELPKALLSRLGQVADHHGGVVPLHGRLFAQWLHHAYPLECPYPHERGTTNPTAWTGQESDQATDDEMRQHIEADTCSVNADGRMDCGEDSADLPWNTAEELLVGSNEELQDVGSQFSLIFGLGLTAASALALFALRKDKRIDRRRSATMLAGLMLAGLASWMGLLDPMVMVVGAVGGMIANLSAIRARRSLSQLPKTM